MYSHLPSPPTAHHRTYYFALLHPSSNKIEKQKTHSLASSPNHLPFIIVTSTNETKTHTHKQLQRVLSEFDFLHDIDHPQPQHQAHHQSRPANVQMPSTPPILQQRPQIVFSADRPVMSMPPVILMGGPIYDGGNSNYKQSSMPSSPIVEMPPSPAPSSMMYVEFPGDEIDEVNIVQNIVEVRIESIFSFAFSFFSLLSRTCFSLVIHLFSIIIIHYYL